MVTAVIKRKYIGITCPRCGHKYALEVFDVAPTDFCPICSQKIEIKKN